MSKPRDPSSRWNGHTHFVLWLVLFAVLTIGVNVVIALLRDGSLSAMVPSARQSPGGSVGQLGTRANQRALYAAPPIFFHSGDEARV